MSVVLVTGAAGFIGYHTTQALLKKGYKVLGIDNLDPYYDVRLKRDRLKQLEGQQGFTFHLVDICDPQAVNMMRTEYTISHIVHLAAQAGVRHSLSHPLKYAQVNVVGHLNILELARQAGVEHLIYASSSSVYGGNTKLPFSVEDPVDQPISLYAATKRSTELMSYTYSHLFGIPSTGLRFFTVYGPWGRPDMAAFLFTKGIDEEQEIQVFNHGQMKRNFTYIDDIVQGVVASLENTIFSQEVPHRLYNLGNDRAEELMTFIKILEDVLGKKAKMRWEPLQPGDVPDTIADITLSRQELGFSPQTSIHSGLASYVNWYKEYYEKRVADR